MIDKFSDLWNKIKGKTINKENPLTLVDDKGNKVVIESKKDLTAGIKEV